jgi:hypothetical protein
VDRSWAAVSTPTPERGEQVGPGLLHQGAELGVCLVDLLGEDAVPGCRPAQRHLGALSGIGKVIDRTQGGACLDELGVLAACELIAELSGFRS